MRADHIRRRVEGILDDIGLMGPPVDLDPVIAFFGAVVQIDPSMPDGLEGVLALGGSVALICVNARYKGWRRRRFTTAHELGHLALHAETGAYAYALERSRRRTRLEREASRFASELLMPEEWVRYDWRRHPSFEAMQHRYQVSREALSIRLRHELGLISEPLVDFTYLSPARAACRSM